jgi:hypothetical protein
MADELQLRDPTALEAKRVRRRGFLHLKIAGICGVAGVAFWMLPFGSVIALPLFLGAAAFGYTGAKRVARSL